MAKELCRKGRAETMTMDSNWPAPETAAARNAGGRGEFDRPSRARLSVDKILDAERTRLEIFQYYVCATPVLGPFRRAVIWVQGCLIGCEGCILPEAWDPALGKRTSITEAAAWVLSCEAVEGITLTGGEPMEQPAGLCELIDIIRQERDFGVVTYTGYTLEGLRAKGDTWQHELLLRTDLLIDGPYARSQHGRLLWRGSTNQRLINLTSRYAGLASELHTDTTAGIEVNIDSRGDFRFVGVPPSPDFRSQFREKMLARGITFREGGEEQ